MRLLRDLWSASLRPRTWLIALALVCSSAMAAPRRAGHRPAASQPAALPTDPAFAALLKEAEDQHRQRAHHLEADTLEKAIAMLPSRHPERTALIARLVNLCRTGLGHYARAERWLRINADELRPTPEGIDALFLLADACFNHGRMDEALAIYREILKRIVSPTEPHDRDVRCHKAWRGEELCKFPLGCDPLFPSDLAVTGRVGRVQQLARSGSWRDIRTLLDENPLLQWAIQQPGEQKIWASLRLWVRNALAEMPKESLRALDAAYEHTIAGLASKDDWRAIAAFRLSHPIPDVEARVDALIGDKLLDLGRPGLASLYYGHALRNAGVDVGPTLAARELFSRIRAGEMVRPETVPETPVEVGGRRQSLREWALTWAGATSKPSASETGLDIADAVMTRVPMLRATVPLLRWQDNWRARESNDTYPYLDEFVPCIPAGSARSMVINMGEAIEAVDGVDGRVLWTFQPPEENPMPQPGQKFREREAYVMCAKTRTAVVNNGRVFCQLLWGHHDTNRDAGALFALRESDGAMLWSTLYLPELAGTTIAADPALCRGVLVALAWRPREALPLFFVVGISAETGELLWTNHLYSGGSLVAQDNEHFLDLPATSGAPAVADDVAYVTTGAGVVAAVDVMDGTTVWATQYPRVRGINAQEWVARMATSRPPGIVAIFPDVVLFAPIDAHCLLAVERATGKIRYTRESVDLRAIAAADAERAYVVEGTTVRAVRPADGQTIWEQPLSTSGLVGLPTLGPRGLLCPSWENLYLLDPASGEIRARRAWSREEACGYVQDLGDRLLGVSQTGIHILAARKLDETGDRWLSPESDRTPADVVVPSRADKWLRWVMPGMVNRGDFVLSSGDPDHFLTRSELLQMRRVDPVPTLCWERLSPLPGGCEALFNQHWVLLWTLRDVYVIDAAAGRSVWEDHPYTRLGRPIAGAWIVGKEVWVYLGWEGGKVLSQTAPTFVVFDGQRSWEAARSEAANAGEKQLPVRVDDGDRLITRPADDMILKYDRRRIIAVEPKDKRELWQTMTFEGEPRFILPMSDFILSLTQDVSHRDRPRDMAYVRVFDRKSGERIKAFRLPKRWMHKFEDRNGRILMWDCSFLYCLQPPAAKAAGRETVTVRQDRPDPDAISALRLARDLEDPPRMNIPTFETEPRVDGSLAEWSRVKGRSLEGVADWRPDFTHRSRVKDRACGGKEDLSAEVRFALTADNLCMAVEVLDDVHTAAPGPGLWRSDSLTLQFGEPKGEYVDPLMLTLALVDGIPRFELTTAVTGLAVSDPAGQEPDCGPGPRRFTLPALVVGNLMLLQPTTVVEVAIRRNEASHSTHYELKVPKVLFRYGPDLSWDVLINDNDGLDREGALQLASSTWGIGESHSGSLLGGK